MTPTTPSSVTTLLVKLIKFGCIGGVVFVFDAGLFSLLLRATGTVAPARGVSVALAMALSWWLNRRYTFRATAGRQSWQQMIRFMLSQLPGAGCNTLASLLVFNHLTHNAWLATAAGSIAGLSANFVMANFFVFQKK